MKENRFIELLNLYVDHQIAPEEAAELESEILRSPERRKTYRDYCRMQRACGLLFDRESKMAPASFALEKTLQEAEQKIIAFPDKRKTGWGTYTAAFAGVAAMAACLAVVLIRPATSGFQSRETLAVEPPSKDASPFIAQSSVPLIQTAALSPRTTGLQPVLGGQTFAVGRDETNTSGTEWMQQVQLAPVQRVLVDDTVFEARPTLQQDNRVFRSSRPIQGNVEFTAFQFQR